MQPCGDGCLLRWEKVTDRLEISVSTSDLEMNVGFIPTNEDICAFVEENYHDSHTSPRKPCVCPEEKETAILDALEHFGLIQ